MKILLISIGHLGDNILATPAIQALFDRYPNAEYHCLTNSHGKRIFTNFDARITKHWLFKRGIFLTRYSKFRLHQQLFYENYDHVYYFERNNRYTDLIPKNSEVFISTSNPELHVAQQYLRNVIKPNDYQQINNYHVYLPVSEAGRQAAHMYLQQNHVDTTALLIGLHPSYHACSRLLKRKTNQHKKWPIESFAAVVSELDTYEKLQKIKLEFIADLMPVDKQLGNALSQATSGRIKVLIDKPHFERYKALIARMDLLITPDTGPMHVAAAVGTKTISLFSKNVHRFHPYTQAHNYQIVHAHSDRAGQDGLSAIAPQQVVTIATKFLGNIK